MGRNENHPLRSDFPGLFRRVMEEAIFPAEGPIINDFYNLLINQASFLRKGEINGAEFLKELTRDTEPVGTFFKSSDGYGKAKLITVDRTSEGKLMVSTPQEGSWPQITVTVGLSKGGDLEADSVEADYVERYGSIEPHRVKGETVNANVIDPSYNVSRKAAGRNVINTLINIVPYSEDPED